MTNEDKEFNQIVEILVKDIQKSNSLNETQQINEDVWEKVKYGLSKLGRYKAGGKIMGKKKVDKAAAAQITAIVDKKGNEMIKALHNKIQETNPKFPNNEKGEEFLKTVLEISAVYDSIVDATKNKDKKGNLLSISIANPLIEDLATYVKKYLDVDLSAVYSTMDEEVVNEYVNEIFGSTKKPDAAADVRTQLQGKTGDDAIKRDSERMKTLKSNKLPMVLAGVGTALGALGWLAQTQWMADLITNIFGSGVPAEDAIIQTINGGAPDAEGFVHWASEIQGSSIQTGADVQGFVDKFGIENVQQMFAGNGGGTVEQQGQILQQLIGGDGASKSVGELFNADTFGDMKGGRNLFGISKAGSFVARVVVKQAVKAVAGAGAGIAASVAGIGAVLVPIGIGLIATGALVKLMRVKGQKQSRAKTLNDLFQSIQPVKPTPENPGIDLGPTDDGGNTVLIDKLTIIIRRLLIFINTFEVTADTGPIGPASDSTFPGPSAKPKPKPKPEPTPQDDEEDYWNQNQTWDNTKQFDPFAKKKGGFNYDYKPNMGEGELDEGRYIKDPNILAQLNKLVGNEETVKKFEGFIVKLVGVRNAIKKLPSKATGDINLDNKVEKLKANPMMNVNFMSLIKINSDEPGSIESLKDFIVDVVKLVESGKMKHANMLDKLTEKSVTPPTSSRPKPKFGSVSREQFKKSLLPFMGDVVTLFRHLQRFKKNAGVATKTDTESLAEQVDRIKKLISY